MDRHKSLYKENSAVLSPINYNRRNVGIRKEKRQKHRLDIHQSARNISLSPTPTKGIQENDEALSATSTPFNYKTQRKSLADDFANVVINSTSFEKFKENSSIPEEQNHELKTVVQNSTKQITNTRTKRQEIFLRRFLDYKEAKKEEALKRKNATRPFVPAGAAARDTAKKVPAVEKGPSFLPKGKGHVFKAPDGLINPAASKEFQVG